MHACDLADRSAVEALLATIGQVNAVVHAAGVGEDVALVDADEEHLRRVVGGKVDGALHLDALVGDVDAFVVFSSISGIWGSAEQAAYGAANAALDALIARRRASGLPGTARGLGPVGTGRHGRRRGGGQPAAPSRPHIRWIPPVALAALAFAVGSAEAAVTVADVRWAEFLPLFTAARPRPLLADLPEASVPVVAPGSGSGLAARLAGLAPAERTRSVLDLVRAEVAAVLGHSSAGAVEPDRAFKELGFDSLTAVELRNRLQVATGLGLPATLVFDYPNAERLAAFVLGRLAPSTLVSDATIAEVIAPVDDDPIVIVGMGLPLPRRGRTPRGAVGPGRRGRRRDRWVSDRSGLGPGGAVPPGSGACGDLVRP